MFNEEDSMFSRNLQDTFKIARVNLQEAGDSFGISRPLLTLQSAPFIAGDETVLEIIITQHSRNDVRRFALTIAPAVATKTEGNCDPQRYGMYRCLWECRSRHLACWECGEIMPKRNDRIFLDFRSVTLLMYVYSFFLETVRASARE